MTPNEKSERVRRTADERRADVLDAALIEFSTYGLHGASTVNIAERAGISQPYVLRLFETKKKLFLATVSMVKEMLHAAWQEELSRLPEDAEPMVRLRALASAFQSMASRAEVLRLLLQAYSASAEDDVRRQNQRALAELYTWVRKETGVPAPVAQVFFARGMMIMVGVSVGAYELLDDEEWARAFMLHEVPDMPGPVDQ